MTQTETVKINIGAGQVTLPGYLNVDRKTGQEAYPLDAAECSVDEIRASHILEHFSYGQVAAVLQDWVSKLKPGGVLKIAVPDFALIAHNYLSGQDINIQGYIMGGHTDNNDVHLALFDEECLREVMTAAGLTCISRWNDGVQDCSSLPISLNLQGTKPGGASIGNIQAVMSVPRLGFMDNYFSAFQALVPLRIPLRRSTGAFWGQCLEAVIEEAIAEGADWVLTLDYDTVFTRENVEALISLAARHPEADAIAPIQAHRVNPTPLMTLKDENGNRLTEINIDYFAPELSKVATAHFGLTLINAKKISAMPRPWFWSKPDPATGTWHDSKVDDDIYFWKEWEKEGNTLFLANRVPVGHLELMIRWPNETGQAFYQHSIDFMKKGKPEGLWK